MFVKKYAFKNPDGTVHPSETWDPSLDKKQLSILKRKFREDLLAFVPRDVADPKVYTYRLQGLVTRTREVFLLY